MAEERTIRYRVTAATQGFQQGMTRSAASAQQASGRITRSMQRNQQALQAAGVAGIGMGVALGTGLATAVSAASDFQAEMNQVRAVSGATGSEFEELSGVAREMGASTKFGATEAAEGLSFLSMAGFEAQESVEALPGVLDLAAAGGMELGRSADIASNVLQGFTLEAEDMDRVVDTMAATFTDSNTSLEQMGQALGFVAPVASAAGLELEETAAAVGLMGDAGIQGTRAGTALRQSLSSLLSPTGSAEEAIERLGLEVTDSKDRLLPLHDIIGQLEDRGATAADIMDLFGQRAGPGMQALLDRGSDAIQQFTGDLEDSGGTAEDVADTQLEGLKGSMTELGSAVEGLQIKIAEDGGLLDSMESLTDTTTTLVRALESAPDELVGFTTELAGSTAVVSTFGGALALVASKMGGLGAVAGALSKGLAGGILFQGATKALGELGDSAESADAKLDDIVDTSASLEEAERRVQQETQNMGAELLNSVGPVEQWNKIWSGEFGGIIGMGGDLIETLKLMAGETDVATDMAEDHGAALATQRGEVENLTGAVLGLDDATAQTGPTRERADALDEEGAAAAHTADKLRDVSGSLENLSGRQEDAADAVAKGVDTFDTYQGLLDDRKDAEREAADATFEAARDTIRAQRDAGAINSEVAQDRIDAARDARDAEVDALDDIGDSWDTFQQAQQDTLDDQREWMANLRDLRERGFDDLADDLAARGPEQAGLVAEAADQSNEALREGEQRAMAIREQNAEAALAQIQSSGENMVSASGAVSDEVVDEIADKLGVLPDDVRGILADTDTVVEGQMRAVGETFGKGAEGAVRQMAERLDAGSEEVAGIVSRYASLVARGIQPVMEGIGASREAQALQRFVAGDRITGLAAGGIADEPTVMVGEGPGPEAVIPMYEGMGATRERNVALWEHTGRQLGMDLTGGADRRMAAGGVLPSVPGMGAHGDMLGSSGAAAMDRTREEAVLFLERQAPERMARGGIIARGGEPVASRQPDRAAGSQTVDRSVKVGQVVAHDYDDFIAQMGRSQRVAALQGTRR